MKKPAKKATRPPARKPAPGKPAKKGAPTKKTAKVAPAKKAARPAPKPAKKTAGKAAVKRPSSMPKPVKKILPKKPVKKTAPKAPVKKQSKPAKPAKAAPKKQPTQVAPMKKTAVSAKKPVKQAPAKKAVKPTPAPAKKTAKKVAATAKTAPAKAAPIPAPNAPEKPTPAAKADAPKAVSSALKGKLMELQKRTALKRSRAPMFSFDDAAEVLGARKGSLKIFKTLETDSVKKVQKKQDFLPKVKQRSVGAASLDDILGGMPTKGIVRKDPNPEDVPQKFRRNYKLLLDMRKRVSEGLDVRTKDTLKRSTKEDSGDLASYSSDSGTDTFDRDFALNLVSSEQDLLFEIDQAIKRLGDGSYGICEINGKPIPADRLLAIPFTRYSLEGQKELEGTGKVRKTYIEPPTNLTETSEEDTPSFADDDDE